MGEVNLYLISMIICKPDGDTMASRVFAKFCVDSDPEKALARFMETAADSEEAREGWHFVSGSRTQQVVDLNEINRHVAERVRRSSNVRLQSVS